MRGETGSARRQAGSRGRALSLRITSTNAGAIVTSVLSDPGKGASNEAPHPFARTGTAAPMLDAALAALEGGGAIGRLSTEERTWLAGRGWVGPGLQAVPDIQQQIGAALFGCLFSGKETARALEDTQKSGAVAYKLLIGRDDPAVARLPWELLHDGGDFCIRGGRGTMARQIFGLKRRACGVPAEPRRMRVLLVAPRPRGSADMPMLDDAEAHEVRRVGPALDVSYLVPPTFDAFKREMQALPGGTFPDVIHFDGHGFFGRVCPAPDCQQVASALDRRCRRCGGVLQAKEEGYLVWEEPDSGRPAFVSGAAIAEQVGLRMGDAKPALQLVVLTACRSGSVGRRAGIYDTVAARLIAAEVPSVLAVQGDIEVTSARTFAGAFYRTLAAGQAVADAVAAARTALWQTTQDWYRPAYYVRDETAGCALVKPLVVDPPWPKKALDAFIEQDRVVDTVERAVLFERGLVTLTGPGGGGKSRVARQVILDLDRTAFCGGSYLIELADAAPIDKGESRATLLSKLAFRLELASAELASVLAYFRGKVALLVLDGFDDFRSAGDLVRELLEGTDGLTIMLTTELELNLQGVSEQVREIPLLDTLALVAGSTPREVEANCAVKLLLARVRPKNPGFAVTAENAAAIAEIVRRLDGLPRAIELAAPFLHKGNPSAFLADLVQQGIDLFDGAHDMEARRKTLTKTFELSFGRLSGPHQVLYRRLAVFCGGFDQDDAVMVFGAVGMTPQEVRSGIQALDFRSLLPDLGANRYRLREDGRQYAAGLLAKDGAREALEAGHAAYFLGQVLARVPHFIDGRQPQAIDWVTTNYANVEAAFLWLLRTGDRAGAGKLVIGLGGYWYIRGLFSEGRSWLERMAPLGDGQTAAAHAGLLDLRGVLQFHQSELDDARRDLEHAIDLAEGDAAVQAMAFGHLGYVQLMQDRKTGGDFSASAASLARAEQLYDVNEWGLGWIMGDAGYAALLAGDLQVARTKFDRALELRSKSGDRWLLAMGLHYQGLLAYEEDRFEDAASLQQQCLDIAERLGYSRGAALAHFHRARALLDLDPSGALGHVKESLRLRREQGDRSGQIECLNLAATIAMGFAAPQAARLVGALGPLWLDYPDHRATPAADWRATLVQIVPDADAQIAAGARLDLDAAVKEALAL